MRILSAPITTEIAKPGTVPRALYHFTMKDKDDGSVGHLRLTDHHANLTFQGVVYNAYSASHSPIKTFLKNQTDNCNVMIDNVDKGMSSYLASNYFSGMFAEIHKVFLDSAGTIIDNYPTTDDKIFQFAGLMDKPRVDQQQASVRIVNMFDRSRSHSPYQKFSISCGLRYCEDKCLYNSGNGVPRGTATSGSTTTLVDTGVGSYATDYWKGAILKILSGPGRGEFKRVSAYNNSTKTFTVEFAFSTAITSSSRYIIECDKDISSCREFSNEVNFGGFIPYDVFDFTYTRASISKRGTVRLSSVVQLINLSTPSRAIADGRAIPIVYGTVLISPLRIGEWTDPVILASEGKDYLVGDRIYGICVGEIDSIVDVTVNDKDVTVYSEYLGTSGQSFDFHGTTLNYKNTAVLTVNLNYNDQVDDDGASWSQGGWTGESEFSPNDTVNVTVKGLKVQQYDSGGSPSGSPAYSDNPAWCILDFIAERSNTPVTEWVVKYGGVLSDYIDLVSFYDAAQACATYGYALSINIDEQTPDSDILDLMFNTCRGYFTYTEGKVKLNIEEVWVHPVEDDSTPAHVFDDTSNDNIGENSFQYFENAVNDTPNKIIVEYIDQEIRKTMALIGPRSELETLYGGKTYLPKAETTIPYSDLQGELAGSEDEDDLPGTVYIGGEAITYTGITDTELTGCSARASDYPSGYPLFQGQRTFPEMSAIYNDYDDQDKVRRVIDETIDGEAISSYRHAYAIAEFKGRKSVQGNQFAEFKGLMDSLHLTVGDVVTITHGLPGWTVEQFRIIEASESADEEVGYILEVYDSSFYVENESVLGKIIVSSLPNPRGAPDHALNLAIEDMSYRQTDGTYVPSLHLTYDPPASTLIFWSHAKIQIKVVADEDSGTPLYRLADGSYSDDSAYNVYRDYGDDVSGGKGFTVGGSGLFVIGDKVYVRVIAYSMSGVAADLTTSPTVSHAVADPYAPSAPTGLRLEGAASPVDYDWDGLKFAIVWNGWSNPFSKEKSFGGKGLGDDSASILTATEEVEFWTGGTLRHTIKSITGNRYEYVYGDGADAFLDSFMVASNGTATIKVRRRVGNVYSDYAEITVEQVAPATPGSLSTQGWMRSSRFEWARSTETDFSHYEYRLKLTGNSEDSGWSSWIETPHREILRPLSDAEITTYGDDATVHIEVKAVDVYANESSSAATTQQIVSLNVAPTDIDDFAISASKMFTKIPVVEGDSWTDDDPAANYVAWNAHQLYYNGVKYEIASGSTNHKYIYWDGSSSSYSTSISNPGLGDGQFVIATNISGTHDLAWNAIANEVIGSAYIQSLAVNDAHINNCSVDKLTAGSIASKDIVLVVTPTLGDSVIRAGKTDFADSSEGFVIGIDDSDSDKAKFIIGNASSSFDYGVTTADTVTLKGNLIIQNVSAVQSNINVADGSTAGATWGADISNEPSELSDVNTTEGSKLTGISPGADVTGANTSYDTAFVNGTASSTIKTGAVRANTGLNSSGQIVQIIKGTQLPTIGMTNGLNITAEYIGYYNSGWQTYIGNTGNFFFKGDSTHSIDWNVTQANTLTIKGSFVASSGTGKRIEINPSSDNEIHFHGDRGDTTVEEVCTIGINSVAGDWTILDLGSANNTNRAIYALGKGAGNLIEAKNSGVTGTEVAIKGETTGGNSTGVYGLGNSSTATGVKGVAGKYGVHGWGSGSVGIGVLGVGVKWDFQAEGVGIISIKDLLSSDPSNAGTYGQLYVKNGALYYKGTSNTVTLLGAA